MKIIQLFRDIPMAVFYVHRFQDLIQHVKSPLNICECTRRLQAML